MDENDEVSDRMAFIRKVYGILTIQLGFTASLIALVQLNHNFRMFVMKNMGVGLLACAGSIATMCAIICCYGRKYPVNYVLLGLFTLCEGYGVAAVTSRYPADIVMLAGLATFMVSMALTVYAMTTKTDISVFYGMSFVVCLAMIPLGIICCFCGIQMMHTMYAMCGLVLYSLYLIIDTIEICGNKASNSWGTQVSYDDYIIGAMVLYIDIIMLFLELLKLIGDSQRD